MPMNINWVSVAVLAVLTESVVENIKWAIEGNLDRNRIMALIAGILLALGTGIDAFKLANIPVDIPGTSPLVGHYIGAFFTGILTSRGSNVLHDLWGLMNNVMTWFKDKNAPTSVI